MALDNPDHVAVVIHNYRWRQGLAEGEAKYDPLEQKLASTPAITVPSITLEGDANGAPHPEPSAYASKFIGPYAHRTVTGGIGHNLFGVPVPQGYPAFSVDEAGRRGGAAGRPGLGWSRRRSRRWRAAARAAGRRSPSRWARSTDRTSEAMLGMTLVTHQTGPKGRVVRRLYIEEGADIARELYLSLLIDRETSRVAVVASTEGGMDIEEVAHNTPEKIATLTIDPATGVSPAPQPDVLAKALNLTGGATSTAARALLPALSTRSLRRGSDMSLLEVNPLIVTGDDKLVVLDAKISFDDNALYRHEDIRCAPRSERVRTSEARPRRPSTSFLYIKRWSGEISCMGERRKPRHKRRRWTTSCYGCESRPTSSTWAARLSREEGHGGIQDRPPPTRTSKAILVNIFGGIACCDIASPRGSSRRVKEVSL